MLHRYTALALLASTLPGCSSRPEGENVRPTPICVSERAAVGARVRVRSPDIAPEHSPVYVITRIDGPARRCAKNARLPIGALAVPDWQFKGPADQGDVK